MPDGEIMVSGGAILVVGGKIVTAPLGTSFCPTCGGPYGRACKCRVSLTITKIVCPVIECSHAGDFFGYDAATSFVVTGGNIGGTWTLKWSGNDPTNGWVGIDGWYILTDVEVGTVYTGSPLPPTPPECPGTGTSFPIKVGFVLTNVSEHIDGVSDLCSWILLPFIYPDDGNSDGGPGTPFEQFAVGHFPNLVGDIGEVVDGVFTPNGETATIAFDCVDFDDCGPCVDCLDPEGEDYPPASTAPDTYPPTVTVNLAQLSFCPAVAVACGFAQDFTLTLQSGSSPTGAEYIGGQVGCFNITLVWDGTNWLLSVYDIRSGSTLLWQGYLVEPGPGVSTGPTGEYMVICGVACGDNASACLLNVGPGPVVSDCIDSGDQPNDCGCDDSDGFPVALTLTMDATAPQPGEITDCNMPPVNVLTTITLTSTTLDGEGNPIAPSCGPYSYTGTADGFTATISYDEGTGCPVLGIVDNSTGLTAWSGVHNGQTPIGDFIGTCNSCCATTCGQIVVHSEAA